MEYERLVAHDFDFRHEYLGIAIVHVDVSLFRLIQRVEVCALLC